MGVAGHLCAECVNTLVMAVVAEHAEVVDVGPAAVFPVSDVVRLAQVERGAASHAARVTRGEHRREPRPGAPQLPEMLVELTVAQLSHVHGPGEQTARRSVTGRGGDPSGEQPVPTLPRQSRPTR